MDKIKERWYLMPMTLEEAESFIQENMVSAVRSYVATGYYLRRIRDDKLYQESGYDNFEAYVENKYDKDKGWASKCIRVNQELSIDGNTPNLDKRYLEYSTYQLVELSYLSEGQREQTTPDMTVKQIREVRKPEKVVMSQLSEFQEPVNEPQITAEPQCEQKQNDVLPEENGNVESSSCPPENGNCRRKEWGSTPEEQNAGHKECQACWAEWKKRKKLEQDANEREAVEEAQKEEAIPDEEDPRDIIDGEFTEIKNPITETGVFNKSILADMIAREIEQLDLMAEIWKENQPGTYSKHVMALQAYQMFLEVGEITIEDEPEIQEQPALPILKNNDQRAAFVDAYETWPLWIETVLTGERYYRYDLADGTSMVVKVYHARLFDYKAAGTNWEERYSEGWGKHEYYLLQEGKFFRDCDCNRSFLIEKLKEIQKK